MTTLGKGELAEEALRNYFLEQGYFVVRSLPFLYGQIDITDIDLWLYRRTSPFTRERINVDVKNKNEPKAFERIIWAKGLQISLQLEKSIVATTSIKKEIRDFSVVNDVILIDGNLFNHLMNKSHNPTRITEEDFVSEISRESSGKDDADWKRKYLSSKARLINKLNFDGCNEYLREINYFLGQFILRADISLVPLRLLYINIAFFLVCLDFLTKSFIPIDQKSRIELLINGFNYGERGKERTESITNAAIKLASSVIANPSIGRTLQIEIENQRKERPVDILANFFCKDIQLNHLSEIAKSFESFSYSPVIITPSKLPIELQSILGLLTDFHRVDRKRIFL